MVDIIPLDQVEDDIGGGMPSFIPHDQVIDDTVPSIWEHPVDALTSKDWWLTRPSGETITAKQAVAGPLMGALNALTFGGADETVAGGNALLDALGGKPLGNAYDQRLAEARNIDANTPTAAKLITGLGAGLKLPIPSMTGKVASNLPKADSLMGVLSNTGKLGATLAGEGAAYGGAYGFGSGEDGFWKRIGSAGQGATLGAGTNLLLGGAARGIGNLAGKVSKSLGTSAENLKEKALGIQYGEKVKGLNRVNYFIDSEGNILPWDKLDDAIGIEAPIQKQVGILEESGILQNAPKSGGAENLKIYMEQEARKASKGIGQLINIADDALPKADIPVGFESAQKYVNSFRDTTRQKLQKELDSIVEDYIAENGSGFRKLTGFTDKLQKETNFDIATTKEVTQLKRFAAFDLRKASENAFDLALPGKAGEFAKANELTAALKNVGKTLNKKVAKGEPSILEYLKGGSQPMTVLGSALAVPFGIAGGAGGAGLGLLANALRKGAEAKSPLRMAAIYEALGPKTAKLSDKLNSVNLGKYLGATNQLGIIERQESPPQPQQSSELTIPPAPTTEKLEKREGERSRSSKLNIRPGSPSGERELFSSPNSTPTAAPKKPRTVREAIEEAARMLEEKDNTMKLKDISTIPDGDLAPLVRAVIGQESGGKTNAVSPKGARGVMQIMPSTAKEIAKEMGLESYDLNDPETNIAMGTHYLKKMLKQFGGDLELALAAYNAGPNRVRTWMRQFQTTEWDKIANRLNEAGAYKETVNYVPAIMKKISDRTVEALLA